MNGPSRVVVWSAAGKQESKRYASGPDARAAAAWKVHLLGAQWAEARDDHGNVNCRFERQNKA